MRLARIASPDGVCFAALDGDGDDISAREIAEHPFGTPTFTGRKWRLADTRLLAPILASKVICIGKNYPAHAAEMARDSLGSDAPQSPDPVIFIKPNTAIIGPDVPIARPASSDRVDFEGELAVVIGRPCRDVAASRAGEAILGYTIANDVTARDQQKIDGQWTRAKGYDTFCPLGPWIDTDFDPTNAELTTSVNHDGVDEVRQRGNTGDMTHDVGAIVEWISTVMTLLPGDVILTGTPAGIGPLVAGDTVSVSVTGLGTLTNPVIDRAGSR